MDSQEIVDRIERYEVNKKRLFAEPITREKDCFGNIDYDRCNEQTKQNKQEFKVGDWVRAKDNSDVYKIVATACDGKIPIIAYPDGSDNFIWLNTEFWEHAEPPKKEKPKIERMLREFDDSDAIYDCISKIN